jgi:hypothetical protein
MTLFEDNAGNPRVELPPVEHLPTAAVALLKRFCEFHLADLVQRYSLSLSCREFCILKLEGRRILAALEEPS